MVIGMLASYRYLFDVHPSRVQEDREQALDDFRTGNSYSALVDIYDSQSFFCDVGTHLGKGVFLSVMYIDFQSQSVSLQFFFSMA